MNKILRDIESIIQLANEVHSSLSKNKIKKAKKEIKEIIALDIDELRRLQQKHGDKRLLKECLIVLRNAKTALRDLSSYELFDEAKELMDKIIIIEKHELVEERADEKELNDLYEWWYNNCYNLVLYHGTLSIAVERIKRYGLVPGMVPWDQHDFNRLDFLMKKAGHVGGISELHHGETIGEKVGVFLIRYKKNATELARKNVPEMWVLSLAGGSGLWEKRDYNSSLFGFYLRLIPNYSAIKLSKRDVEELHKLFSENIRQFKLELARYSYLSTSEINEAVRIFNKFWNTFDKSKPVVLTISGHAPAIRENLGILRSFNGLMEAVNWLKTHRNGSLEDIISEVNDNLNATTTKITKRIPAKYIVEYEYV